MGGSAIARKRYVSQGTTITGEYAPSRSRLTAGQIMEKVSFYRGCWVWPDIDKRTGYPRGSVHRRAHEIWVGPLLKGAEIDHKCRNRACVNPQHLRQVNRSYNSHLRQTAKTGQMSRSDLRVAIWVHDTVGDKLMDERNLGS